ncbi:MAG: BamA/TamA family outer membrane protein, partial [Steroidobacteraceae bacterium]
LYSEVGIDGRNFWTLPGDAVLALRVALRYMPRTARTRNIPFWALSSIGGDSVLIGGDQPLRGFGTGRFRDRNSSSISIEYRKRIVTLNAFSTRISLEITPFVDMGRVFNRFGTDPLSHLHKVFGVGFRGIALPFVVGYVDVGYGTEGAAVFTGLNYPF